MTSYVWSNDPPTNIWTDPNDWSPEGVPNASDTATFGVSSQTQITVPPSSGSQVSTIVFAGGALPYTFQFSTSSVQGVQGLAIMGDGVVNQSSSTQSFVVAATSIGITDPQLVFGNSATAGGANVSYAAGPVTPDGAGGGVISFVGSSNAGSASFTVTTGFAAPVEPSTVGGEVSFNDSASAANATFTTYGTTGSDGDTFGTVGFHGSSTAANASFTNIGGTVNQGDGGNTQFYDDSTAASATFTNLGASTSGANGGDVAFDGTASGAQGTFNNYAATATKGYGGVTSFNNNPPQVSQGGASAGNGTYNNYGASSANQGGGGHTEFTGKYGSPNGAWATINNYGGQAQGAEGGYTSFSATSSAGSATIAAYGGTNGGYGGKISFYDASTGGETTIRILGGELSLSYHTGPLVIGALEMNGGVVSIALGTTVSLLTVWANLILDSSPMTFSFYDGDGFALDTPYTVLTAPNMSQYALSQFAGNSIQGVQPNFSFSSDGTGLIVTYPS